MLAAPQMSERQEIVVSVERVTKCGGGKKKKSCKRKRIQQKTCESMCNVKKFKKKYYLMDLIKTLI